MDPPAYYLAAQLPVYESLEGMSEAAYEDQRMEEEGPPGMDADELRAILSTLSAFHLYRRASHRTITHQRRTAFYALPRSHQEILREPPISYLSTLDSIDNCIENNSEVAEGILQTAGPSFGVNIELSEGWQELADSEDLDKVRSTIKQFYRDWSAEGADERERCYGPILKEIDERFGSVAPRHKVEILLPGAGLGRLAFEVARLGYASQGNEFSYHQLMSSNWVLNCVAEKESYTIHPFVSSSSNHRTRENQLRACKIPDIHPASELLRAIDAPDGTYKPADHFSMIAGDFTHAYNNTESAETFDCVATVFFIDTASNVLTYLETIRNVLKPGGVWINLGPLLWHWEGRDMQKLRKEGGGHEHSHDHEQEPTENGTNGHAHGHDSSHSHGNGPCEDDTGSVELTLDEVLVLVEHFGFKIEKRKTIKTGYIEDGLGMMKWDYDAEFWVAIKA